MSNRTPSAAHHDGDPHSDIIYPGAIPFALAHLACFGMIWTGVSAWSLAMCFVLYAVRMWGVTAGYHRYFSHRTFRTSRLGQFFLALTAQSSAQRGVIWWAAEHRAHHKYSDTPNDPHSPKHTGFLFAHMGWFFSKSKSRPDYTTVTDLTKFPELRLLDRHQHAWPIFVGTSIWYFMGWEALVVGWLLSTVLLYHGTFMINSVAHVIGRQRYVTGDESKNNWWLAIITLGEGWHNNHHHFQSATRQGFMWYEIDITYYVLRALAAVGLVWDLKSPPADVVKNETRLRGVVVEKVARQLAATFSIDAISEEIRAAWNATATVDDIREKARQARVHAEALLSDVSIPQLPTMDELKTRAAEMFTISPSMDDIVARARLIILQGVSLELFDDPNLMPAALPA